MNVEQLENDQRFITGTRYVLYPIDRGGFGVLAIDGNFPIADAAAAVVRIFALSGTTNQGIQIVLRAFMYGFYQ